MTIISTTTFVVVFALLAVAAVTAVLAIAVGGQFVLSNRRTRLARHESIPAYYSRFHLSHSH